MDSVVWMLSTENSGKELKQVSHKPFPSVVHACMLSCFSSIWLFVTLWTVAHQALLFVGFSRQECWSGLPRPPLGDLSHPGIEPASSVAPESQADSLPLSHWRSPFLFLYWLYFFSETNNTIHLLMKIINKHSIIEIENNFSWAKLRTLAQKIASQITLGKCSGEAWFSVQFYISSEQRTLNMPGMHSFKVSKNTDQHIHSESLWLWHLGRESYHQRNTSIDVQEQESRVNLYF